MSKLSRTNKRYFIFQIKHHLHLDQPISNLRKVQNQVHSTCILNFLWHYLLPYSLVSSFSIAFSTFPFSQRLVSTFPIDSSIVPNRRSQSCRRLFSFVPFEKGQQPFVLAADTIYETTWELYDSLAIDIFIFNFKSSNLVILINIWLCTA